MVLGVVVVMFSLVSRPAPLPMEIAAEPFDETAAAATTHRLLAAAPERTPGSEGDRAAADFMRSELEALEGGMLSSDRFTADFDREQVEMENLIYTLTGETDDLIVVTAPRDCREGPCAASSASASGALLELARAMSRTQRRKTMMFVSTDGSVAGAAGAKQLAGYLDNRTVTAVIALIQPGARAIEGRHIVPWSTSARGTAAQLTRTVGEALETELDDAKEPLRGTASELVRLAIPAGLGEQAPLIAAGFDAVGLSGSGDRPLDREADEAFSAETLGMIGRSTLSLIGALDRGPSELEEGPSSRIPLSGKLVPGWALGLLAFTLLLPLAAAALEAGALARRRHLSLLPALAWAASRCLPFLFAFCLLYLFALLRLVPAPPFPFDPDLWKLDLKALVAIGLGLGALVAAQVEIERRLPPKASPEAGLVVLCLMIFTAGLVTYLVSPYLALLMLPALHLILLAIGTAVRSAVRVILIVLAILVPVIVIDAVGSQLGVGFAEAVWQLGLMFTGGQFGPLAALPALLLAGCLTTSLQAVNLGWTNMRPRSLRVQGPSRRYRGTTQK